MTAIILAGGKSSRFGQDKAFIRIKGRSLIERQLKLLKRIFKRIIIVSNRPDKYKFKGIKVVRDIIPHRGPLGGIYSGLVASSSLYNFIIACDMPFLNQDLIRYMMDGINGYDVIIPEHGKRLQPLCAIYSKNCIAPIKRELSENILKITDFLKYVKVKVIGEKEISRFGASQLSFININTPHDLQNLEQLSTPVGEA